MRKVMVRLYEWLDPGLFITNGRFDYREWHAFWIGFSWAFCWFMGDPWQTEDCKFEPHYAFLGATWGVVWRNIALAVIILAALVAGLLISLALTSLFGGATCPK